METARQSRERLCFFYLGMNGGWTPRDPEVGWKEDAAKIMDLKELDRWLGKNNGGC